VLPGIDLLLIRNRQEETLRLFDCKSNTHHESVPLGQNVTRRTEVVYRDGYLRMAYATLVRGENDEEYVQGKIYVFDIRFWSDIGSFRIVELFVLKTAVRIHILFLYGCGVGYVCREGIFAHDESSARSIWADLDLLEACCGFHHLSLHANCGLPRIFPQQATS
jgi:hypothetical protein